MIVMELYFIFILVSFVARAASRQRHVAITVGPCNLTTFPTLPVGGNQSTRKKPSTFDINLYPFLTRTGLESHSEVPTENYRRPWR